MAAVGGIDGEVVERFCLIERASVAMDVGELKKRELEEKVSFVLLQELDGAVGEVDGSTVIAHAGGGSADAVERHAFIVGLAPTPMDWDQAFENASGFFELAGGVVADVDQDPSDPIFGPGGPVFVAGSLRLFEADVILLGGKIVLVVTVVAVAYELGGGELDRVRVGLGGEGLDQVEGFSIEASPAKDSG